jgi:hypothetical protein
MRDPVFSVALKGSPDLSGWDILVLNLGVRQAFALSFTHFSWTERVARDL